VHRLIADRERFGAQSRAFRFAAGTDRALFPLLAWTNSGKSVAFSVGAEIEMGRVV